MDDGAVVAIVVAACVAAVFIVRGIVAGVLKFQENDIKARGGSGLLAGAEDERLRRIENAVEAVAVEVERISENQRFTTKLLNERSGPDSGRT